MAVFDVRDYGAIGNDATDDTAAIKAAITAARAAGGGEIYIPTGTFLVSGDPNNASRGAIELYSNMTLTGDGMGATVIKLVDDFNARINGIVRTSLETAVTNVTVSNLTIDGNRENNIGHQAGFICGAKADSGKPQSDITISGVEARNCTAYGINPHEITTDLLIEDSVSHGNGLDGFVGDFVVDAVYRGNIAYENDRHGFNITTSSHDVLLQDNIAYGNGLGATGGTGIVVQRSDIFPEGETTIPWATNIVIQGGEYFGNSREGVLIKLSDNVTLSGASVHGNARAGVRVEGATDTLITGNQIYNNSQEAQATYDEVNIRLRNDIAVDPPRNYFSTNTQVVNNVIYSDAAIHSRYGIREEATNTSTANPSGTSISGNTISGTASGTISVPNYVEAGTEGNDTLNGTAGADRLAGLGGNDTYTVNHTGDVIVEAAGKGTDTVLSSLNHTLGDNVENLTLTGTAIRATGNALDNFLLGNAAANELEGLGGKDTLDGLAGADALKGGDGDDTYYVDDIGDVITEKLNAGLGGIDSVFSSISYTLADEVENLTLTGTGNTDATGNSGANALTGNAGANVLDGLVGADRMAGRAGNDTYVVDNTGDTVTELANEGSDTVRSSIAYTLGANVENLILTGVLAVAGNGNTLANAITGNAGANRLHGFEGNDTIEGGGGADQIYGDAGNDVFVLRKGDINGDVIEDFDGQGAAAGDRIVLAGFSSAATLTAGPNGTWIVRDGASEETFRLKTAAGANAVLDASDYAFEGTTPPVGGTNRPPVANAIGNAASGAEDTTITGAVPAGSDPDGNQGLVYELVAPVAGLVLRADGTFTYTPADQAFGDVVFQYRVRDPGGLASAGQNFTLTVTPVADAPVAAATGNTARGNEDTLIAGRLPAGSDPDGNAGLTYVLAAPVAGLVLAADGGFSYTPAANAFGTVAFDYRVKDASGLLSAAQSFAITIDPVNDAPVAASANNAVAGDENTLISGRVPAATDVDGVAGLTYRLVAPVAGLAFNADGSFAYTAPDVPGDKFFQYQAVDSGGLASASQSFTITVRDVVAPPPPPQGNPINGTSGKDTLNGTAGSDTIDGKAGADLMSGKAGNDTYYVDTSSDRVVEAVGGGQDRVLTTSSFTIEAGSEVESVTATGTSAVTLKGNEFANLLTGNAAANTLSGGAGNDRLDGGLGKDSLTGGAGADHFVFSTALGTANVDSIKDFVVRDDQIGLSASIFSALAPGTLAASAFVVGTQAVDASDHVIYNATAGTLSYDADGVGGAAAIQFATIGTNLALTFSDFDILI